MDYEFNLFDMTREIAYQNDVSSRQKLNLVGDIKYSLVFKNSHQTILQKGRYTENYIILGSMIQTYPPFK